MSLKTLAVQGRSDIFILMDLYFKLLTKPSVSDINDPIIQDPRRTYRHHPVGHEINQIFSSPVERNSKDIYKVNGWEIKPCDCGLCTDTHVSEKYDPIAHHEGKIMMGPSGSRFYQVEERNAANRVAQFMINWKNVEKWNIELTKSYIKSNDNRGKQRRERRRNKII